MSENNRKKDLVEKILSNRGRSLSDLELLEIMLHSAYNEIESKEVTERIINVFGNLGKIYDTDLYDLKNVTGVNDVAIASIFSVKETLERILKGRLPTIDHKNKVKLAKYLRLAIGQSRKESLRAMYFDATCSLIHEYIQDLGTIDKTPFYIREIIKRGLLVEGTSLIIAHNHPDGNEEPSDVDQKNTKELNLACDKVGIRLIDHIIVTQKSYFSFYDNGLL